MTTSYVLHEAFVWIVGSSIGAAAAVAAFTTMILCLRLARKILNGATNANSDDPQ